MGSWSRVHVKSVTYAATSLGANMMHSVFMFYYIKVYLNKFHVSIYWFNISQVLFMIWNSINDPLFGCIQDSFQGVTTWTRQRCILYGAPLFVLSFMLTWLPWGDYSSPDTPAWLSGVQLVFVLCFYDTLFTFVLLAQCALFTEMSTDQDDRVRLVKYSQIASLIGCTSVYFCESISQSLERWDLFQFMCFVIATLSCCCFVYTGVYARTQYDAIRPTDSSDSLLIDAKNTHDHAIDVTSFARKTLQIFSQPSFVSFILVNFLQIYHMTFISNFAGIICDQLISKDVFPQAYRSVFYGALFTVPQLLVIICSPIVAKIGYFRVIRSSFLLKIFLGFSLFCLGSGHTSFIILFFLLESAGVCATFSLFNLSLADVVDHDCLTHGRRHPLSSMVFGLNALVTKPAMSLAPIFTVGVFTHYGYQAPDTLSSLTPHALNASSTGLSHASGDLNNVGTGSSNVDLTAAMHYTICFVPIVVGLLQLLVWSYYTIRDSHKSKLALVR